MRVPAMASCTDTSFEAVQCCADGVTQRPDISLHNCAPVIILPDEDVQDVEIATPVQHRSDSSAEESQTLFDVGSCVGGPTSRYTMGNVDIYDRPYGWKEKGRQFKKRVRRKTARFKPPGIDTWDATADGIMKAKELADRLGSSDETRLCVQNRWWPIVWTRDGEAKLYVSIGRLNSH